MHQLEQMFADIFTDGDLNVAHAEMLVQKSRPVDWQLLNMGMRIGAMMLMILWVVWDISTDMQRVVMTHDNEKLLTSAVPVYRGIGCLVLIPWLWASDVAVWRKLRINYMYVLDCDVRVSQPPRKV
jgi:xenotropic and polytropic retrovirus receptor 1